MKVATSVISQNNNFILVREEAMKVCIVAATENCSHICMLIIKSRNVNFECANITPKIIIELNMKTLCFMYI